MKHEGKLSYAEALGAMLTLRDLLEPYATEAERQAHAFLEAGGTIPGYKLVPKRAPHDSWEDPDKAEKFLARQGLSLEERRKPMEPSSPAKARDLLKAKGQDMKEGSKERKALYKYVKQGVSSGTTIAPDSDSRPAVAATSAAALGEKLKQIGAA